MPIVYIVIDHWFPVARELTKLHNYFFLTNRPAIINAPENLNYIVDNGTYYHGRPRRDLLLLAIKRKFFFILPDILENPEATFRYHLKFLEEFPEESRKYGFLVLQGRNVHEMMNLFDRYEEHGLTRIIKRIAIGGSRDRKERVQIARLLYPELKRKGFYVHLLGSASHHCDSFDTTGVFTWWFGRKYDQQNLRLFIEHFKKWRERWMPRIQLSHFV